MAKLDPDKLERLVLAICIGGLLLTLAVGALAFISFLRQQAL